MNQCNGHRRTHHRYQLGHHWFCWLTAQNPLIDGILKQSMIQLKVRLLLYFGWVHGSKNFTAQKVRLEISHTYYHILEECRNQRVSQLRKSECKSQTPTTIFWRSVGIKMFNSSKGQKGNLKHIQVFNCQLSILSETSGSQTVFLTGAT